MRVLKPWIRFFLLLFLLASLAGCGQERGEDEPSMSEPPTRELVLIENNTPSFRVIIPGSRPEMLIQYGERLVDAINEKYGTKISLEDDFDSLDPWNREPVQNDSIEILFGATNRVESQGAGSHLTEESDWEVKVAGNKILIIANSRTGYRKAVSYFIDHVITPSPTTRLSVADDLYGFYLMSVNNEAWKNLMAGDHTVLHSPNPSRRIQLAAEDLCASLNASTGKTATAGTDPSQAKGMVLTLSRNDDLGFYDYRIEKTEGGYLLDGGSDVSVAAAAQNFVEHIKKGDLASGSYANNFDYTLFDPLCTDASSFVPVWKDSVTVPDWMYDFGEKIDALFDTDGRPLLLSHGRAGYIYPENSIEDTLSNILLGADILEMDVYHTKDNVIVMSHGKVIPSCAVNRDELMRRSGYPQSDHIEDWTFAQIKELDLKITHPDGTVTMGKMASLYEVLLLTRNRCFLMLDKKDAWILNEDVMALAVETDSLQSLLYSAFFGGGRGDGYVTSETAFLFIKPYLKEHPENTELQKWYDRYLQAYNRVAGRYPYRRWALKEGTSGTGYVKETLSDFYRVVNTYGSHVVIWTNDMRLGSVFVSQNYQPTK